jgi:hypothetical protein
MIADEFNFGHDLMQNKLKFLNYNKNLVSRLGIVLLVFIALVGTARAELTQISAFVKANNDCNDYFTDPTAQGNGFENCNIFEYDADGTYVKISPVIAKFESDGGFEASNLYDGDVDKSDWTFDGNAVPGNGTSGSWNYDDGNGLTSYPGIRFWSAKASTGFNLFWQVETTDLESGGNCDGGAGSYLTLSCLQEAAVVLAGTWTTPLGKNGNAKNLSHLVFYNSADAATCTNDCTPEPQVVPEPSTLILFFGGLLALVRRRHMSIHS